jgi:YHS domain-containing protein
MDVDEQTAVATAEYQGTTYYFCAPGCKKAFEKALEKYVRAAPESSGRENPHYPRLGCDTGSGTGTARPASHFGCVPTTISSVRPSAIDQLGLSLDSATCATLIVDIALRRCNGG